MKRWSILGMALLLTGSLRAEPQSRPAPVSFEKEVRPFLAKYCFSCHASKGKPKGGIDLEVFADEKSAFKSRKVWKKAWEMLHTREMPPLDKLQPSAAERERVTDWIDDLLRKPSDGGVADPGPVVLRRLTRFEYNNTIRDLLGIDSPDRSHHRSWDPDKGFPAAGVRLSSNESAIHRRPLVQLPPDSVNAGFNNNGDGLVLSPLLMEKYLDAAAGVLPLPGVQRYLASRVDAALPPRARAGRVVKELASRAFRRPVGDAEIEALLKLYDVAIGRGDSFTGALQVALEGVLVSPHFLFLVERATPPAPGATVRPLDDCEIAARLSYFLWSSLPDAPLADLAAAGKLRDPAVLEAQARRMLRSPKAKAVSTNFAAQWLQLDAFLGAMPDQKKFPLFLDDGGWFGGLRSHAFMEPFFLFEAVVLEDRSIFDLIDPDFVIVDGGLAHLYGLNDFGAKIVTQIKREEDMWTWKRYSITDRRRGGVLTMPAVLTGTSMPERTSPVKRGKWLLEVVLNSPPPPPPANAAQLKEDERAEAKTLTLRQKLEKHRQNPNCAGCHRKMDPLGFALENFDAIGMWRDEDDVSDAEDAPKTWNFHKDGSLDGWTPHGIETTVTGGWVRGTALHGDPQLLSPSFRKSAGLHRVGMRLENRTASRSAQIFFQTTEARGYDAARCVRIPIEPQSGPKDYVFDMSGVPGWKGIITGLRVDPVESPGKFAVDWIGIGESPKDSLPPVIDPTGAFPDGESFRGIVELKRILTTTRKDAFARGFSQHLLSYALGRKLDYYDQGTVTQIGEAMAKDGYKLSALVVAIVKSYPFLNRRTKEMNDE